MQKFEPIFENDVEKIRGCPTNLCKIDLQNKFIGAKRNIINRSI